MAPMREVNSRRARFQQIPARALHLEPTLLDHALTIRIGAVSEGLVAAAHNHYLSFVRNSYCFQRLNIR